MTDIIQKLIRTVVGGLILYLIYYCVVLVLGALASATHIVLPSFVGVVVIVIFILLFIAFLMQTWGFKF